MNAYFTRLSQRALGVAPAVRPVIEPLFVSAGRTVAGLAVAEAGEADRVRRDAASWSDPGEEPVAPPSRPQETAPPPVTQVSSQTDFPRAVVEGRDDRNRRRKDRPGNENLATFVQRVSADAQSAPTGVGAGEITRPEPSRAPAYVAAVAVAPAQRITPVSEPFMRRREIPARDRREPDRPAVAPATYERTPLGQSRLSDADASRLLGQLRALGVSAAPRHAAEGTESTPNIVKVTIGRIEVRAVHPPAPVSAPARAREPVRPTVSLRDYLTKRPGERN
jgi:hypothetical protein